MRGNSREALRAEIRAAFRSPAMPDPAALATVPEFNTRGERHVEYELLGKRWDDLDRAWLQKWWPHFVYLRPDSWRYYLPSLLMACLDEPAQGKSLTLPTISLLTPSYWRLYHLGRDAKFEYQTSLLAPDEQLAVCAFLGFNFNSDDWRYPSALALKWGWSPVPHPVQERCREFFDGLHHYTYPPVDEPEKREVIEMIRSAFDPRSYPGDELCGSGQGDEPSEYALEFRGLDWRSLHPIFLGRNYAALSFLSDPGFVYFIPAFMIADVADEGGNANPVFHLTHGLSDEASGKPRSALGKESAAAEIDWREYTIRRCAGFGRSERWAIIRYLEYRATTACGSEGRQIEQALESYWRSFAGETPKE